MKVYKFGGASIKDVAGVENCARIIADTDERLFIVVSAMGKITNALEIVLDHFMTDMTDRALEKWGEIEAFHKQLIDGLFDPQQRQVVMRDIDALCANMRAIIELKRQCDDYDMYYDQMVSFGEIFSSKIVCNYLKTKGFSAEWVDMRKVVATDNHFREANVLIDHTFHNLQVLVDDSKAQVFVSQGFIGANSKGQTTTLGREGSDYTGAIAAAGLNAESLTIWKDVPGILNADPRYFADTVHIPEMSYTDAVELAYNGAQIIHPKTIKPLKNSGISLYVRPFGDYKSAGSVVSGSPTIAINTPIYILKHNQVLMTIGARDFSFVLEDKLVEVFSIFGRYRMKINLVQSSAVSLMISVDMSRNMTNIVTELGENYTVTVMPDMELLTVRGYDQSVLSKYAESPETKLLQRTATMLKIVRIKQKTE